MQRPKERYGQNVAGSIPHAICNIKGASRRRTSNTGMPEGTAWPKTKEMPLNLWAQLIRVSGQFYMEAHELRPMTGNNCCQGQPPAWKLVRYLRENQVRKKKGHKVLDRTKALYGPRTQTYGETNCSDKKKSLNFAIWVTWWKGQVISSTA